MREEMRPAGLRMAGGSGSGSLVLEPLVLELLQRAVGDGLGDRLVEQVLQRGIGLAHRAGDARTMDRVVAGHLGDLLAAILALPLQEVGEGERVGDDIVEAAVEQVEISLFLGRVEARGRVLVELLDIVGVDGRALRADRLAFEGGGRDVAGSGALGADHPDRRLAIGRGEVDLLLALLGGVHAGEDDVVFVRLQRRDDAVPVLHHPAALHLHLLAEKVAVIDFEAFEKFADVKGSQRSVPIRISFHSFAWASAPVAPATVSAAAATNFAKPFMGPPLRIWPTGRFEFPHRLVRDSLCDQRGGPQVGSCSFSELARTRIVQGKALFLLLKSDRNDGFTACRPGQPHTDFVASLSGRARRRRFRSVPAPNRARRGRSSEAARSGWYAHASPW